VQLPLQAVDLLHPLAECPVDADERAVSPSGVGESAANRLSV
jgi:hypothetical protein